MNETDEQKVKKEDKRKESKAKESDPNAMTVSKMDSSAAREGSRQGSTSTQNPNNPSPNRTNSEVSVITLESLKYLQILDQYVSGKHWDFNLEYKLNALSAIVWSLLITHFIFGEITEKCFDNLFLLLSISLTTSAITCIEMSVVLIVWYISLIHQFINRSKTCLTVITIHLIIGSFNLLVAVIEFGSNTCYSLGHLDSSLEHIIPVKYDIKTVAILHSIVAINMFICAMLLAIKRNDFKFYVLWRKGLLNDYLLLADDE